MVGNRTMEEQEVQQGENTGKQSTCEYTKAHRNLASIQ